MFGHVSILVVVLSSLAYHVCQKLIGPTVNPYVTLLFAYITAFIITLTAMFTKCSAADIVTGIKQISWPAALLGLTIVGIELGYLLAYRSGWKISMAALTANSFVAILLLAFGLIAFRESITPYHIGGTLMIIAGLILTNVN